MELLPGLTRLQRSFRLGRLNNREDGVRFVSKADMLATWRDSDKVDANHMPMLSNPTAVAAIIDAARASGKGPPKEGQRDAQ